MKASIQKNSCIVLVKRLLLTALFALVTTSSLQARTINVIVVAGFPPITTWVRTINQAFVPTVDRVLKDSGSKYQIKWRKGYGGSIAKVGGVLEAIEMGIADVGFVGAVLEPANLPLQNITYYTPFVSTDMATAIETIDELHYEIPAMMKAWERFNQVYLTGAGVGNFDLYTKKPIKSFKELRGMKIGGVGPNLNWLRGLGVSGVQMDATTMYNDLATGIYEGALLPAALAAAIKINEVAPYCLKVGYGAMYTSALSVNKNFWDKLPKEVKVAFRKAARAYRNGLIQFDNSLAEKGFKTMIAKGLTVTLLSDSERREMAMSMPDIAAEWAAPLEKKGIPANEAIKRWISKARQKGFEPVRDWSKGLK